MATDIQNDKLIFRILPAAAHPYVKLARLDRPIGTWLLLLPGWWGIVLASGGIARMTAAFRVASAVPRTASPRRPK